MRAIKTKKCFILFFFILLSFPIWSVEYQKLTLDNGLDIFVLEDSSNPIMQVSVGVRLGYQNQTPKNAGIINLLHEIIWADTANRSEELLLGIDSKVSFSSSDYTYYSLKSPAQSIYEVLNYVSKRIISPDLSNQLLAQMLESYSNTLNSYNSSVEGYINNAVISRMFPEQPWKQEFGFLPELFKEMTPEELRSLVEQIVQDYYLPNNCALFISSPYSAKEILEIAKNYFSVWYSKKIPEEDNFYIKYQRQASKKYVLVSDILSSEYLQLVLKYKNEDFFLSDSICNQMKVASYYLENPKSDLKTQLMKRKEVGLNDPEYLNVSFLQDKKNSALTVQAILNRTYVSPVMQSEFVIKQMYNQSISDDAMKDSFKQLQAESSLKNASMDNFLQSLVLDWTRDKIEENSSTKMSFASIKPIFTENPTVFLLVNTSVYKQYENDFLDAGYELITEKKAAWHSKDYSGTIVKNEKKQIIAPLNSTYLLSDAVSSRVLNYTKQRVYSVLLKNNISVSIQENPFTDYVAISISISGGEMRHPVNQRGMESILIKLLTENITKEIKESFYSGLIQNPGTVISETGFHESYISVLALAKDFSEITQCIIRGFLPEKVNVARVDELVRSEKASWRIKLNTLDYQLQSIALSDIYKETSYSQSFSLVKDILEDVTFQSIKKEYSELSNASLMSVTISGNLNILNSSEVVERELDKKRITNILESTFGLFYPFENITEPEPIPSFKASAKIIKLNRVFTSNIKAEDAGPRPAVLIPTSEFRDPAQLYFQAPNLKANEFPIFEAMIYELEYRMNQKIIQLGENSPTKGIEIGYFGVETPVCYIKFADVTSRVAIQSFFNSIFKEFLTDKKDETLKIMCNRWIINHYKDYGNVVGSAKTIQQYLAYNNDATRAISEYDTVTNADWTLFSYVRDNWFVNYVPSWYFSAETKKQ